MPNKPRSVLRTEPIIGNDKEKSVSSRRPRKVAQIVLEKTVKGERVNLPEIHIAAGYSEKEARNRAALDTKAYHDEIRKWEDTTANKFEGIIDLATTNLEKKLKEESKTTARDYAYVTDIMNKNRNLMRGKATANIETHLIVEDKRAAEKYVDDLLKN